MSYIVIVLTSRFVIVEDESGKRIKRTTHGPAAVAKGDTLTQGELDAL